MNQFQMFLLQLHTSYMYTYLLTDPLLAPEARRVLDREGLRTYCRKTSALYVYRYININNTTTMLIYITFVRTSKRPSDYEFNKLKIIRI